VATSEASLTASGSLPHLWQAPRPVTPEQGRAVELPPRILRLKRGLDILGASLLLLLALPMMVLAALAIRLGDGGPILIAQERVGQHGRRFRCLKLRSMVIDAEAVLNRLLQADPEARREWALRRKLRRDPRVTPVGRFLRASSLDELPQLLNVLRGEMSLVGPRPVLASELAEHYGASGTAHYLAVRPGLTGLWQVSGRSDTSYRQRVQLDIAYVRQISLGLDLLILLRTAWVVLVGRGAC
jgi:lipopolysaccharide/colanic/teichoic acid biosynthesis glycosyltransferase